MVTYIASLFAKPGHELEVTRFYQDLEPLMRAAPGFRGRKIFRARPGTMEAEVRRVTPPEDLKGRGHEGGPEGVHFIMVEQWDSVAERVAFSRGASRARNKELVPHLLPQHSHEFYEDVTPAA
jgi:quinol monooxygenase YgiN